MKPAQIALALLSCAVAGAVGWFAGVRSVEQRFATIVQAHDKARTLGDILPAEQRKALADAYVHGEQMLDALGEMEWEPPRTPAPFVGYVPTPGGDGRIRRNSFGWRGAKEPEQPKPAGVVRIFLTGGSTAYGVGAPSDGDTIGAMLEQRLNADLGVRISKRFEVFTAAAPAYASTHERILVENVLCELEPDYVVAFSGVNDAHWGWRGVNVTWMRTYAEEYFRALHDEALAAAGREPSADVVRMSPEPVSPAEVGFRFERNHRLAWYAAATQGATYVLCLQPSLAVTESASSPPPDGERAYFVACTDEMRARMEALKLAQWRFVDLTRVFDATHRGGSAYLDSYHFGTRGNHRLADAMFQALRELVEAK